MPSSRCQNSIVLMPVPTSERSEIKIGVTLRPLTRYLVHCCTFTLRLRNDIQPTWVDAHVGIFNFPIGCKKLAMVYATPVLKWVSVTPVWKPGSPLTPSASNLYAEP